MWFGCYIPIDRDMLFPCDWTILDHVSKRGRCVGVDSAQERQDENILKKKKVWLLGGHVEKRRGTAMWARDGREHGRDDCGRRTRRATRGREEPPRPRTLPALSAARSRVRHVTEHEPRLSPTPKFHFPS